MVRLTRIEAEEGSISDWPRSAAYFDPVLAGGGALLDVGVHCVDLVRWLAGEFAQVRYSGNQTASAVESEAQLDFELENGVQGSILSSRDRKLRNEVRLIGTEGAITVGLWEMDLLLQRCIGKAFRHFPSLQLCPVRRAPDSSFVDLLAHFVTAIRTGTQLAVNGMEGLKAVEVVQWAYQGVRPSAALAGASRESGVS